MNEEDDEFESRKLDHDIGDDDEYEYGDDGIDDINSV